MNKEIREKLMTIIDIASVDYECSDKQKAKIKYLAKDILLSDFNHEILDVDYKTRADKAAKIRLKHICTEIAGIPNKLKNLNLSYESRSNLKEEWCFMYYKYMNLVALFVDEDEQFELKYDYVPPFSLYEDWKRNNLSNYKSTS